MGGGAKVASALNHALCVLGNVKDSLCNILIICSYLTTSLLNNNFCFSVSHGREVISKIINDTYNSCRVEQKLRGIAIHADWRW